jgi:hypothetical protein
MFLFLPKWVEIETKYNYTFSFHLET